MPCKTRGAVESGRAVLARKDLGGVQKAKVALLTRSAGKGLSADGAQVALHGTQIDGSLALRFHRGGHLVVILAALCIWKGRVHDAIFVGLVL